MNPDEIDSNASYEKWLGAAFISAMTVLLFTFFLVPLFMRIPSVFAVLSNLNEPLKVFITAIPHQIIMLASVPAVSLFIKAPQGLPELLMLRNWKFLYLLIVPAIELFLLPAITIIILFFSAALSLAGFKPDPPVILRILSTCTPESFILIAFSAIIIAPLSEEIIFRHVIFSYLKSKTSTIAAIVGTSLFFAAIHMNIAQFPGLFLLGVVLQLLYIRFNSLYPCILLHVLQNSIATALILLVKSLNVIPTA